MTLVGTDLAELFSAVIAKMPSVSEEEETVVLSLYRLLAEGSSVTPQQLAAASGQPEERVRAFLERCPAVFYEDGAVVGFWGLALGPTGHVFDVGSQRLSTWCAWDALFIPELIGQRAHVESHDPVSGEAIALTVGPGGIEDVSGSSVVVSFLDPSTVAFDDNLILTFCNYVHFFASPASGTRWVAEHSGTFLLSLEDAFDLGRKTNRARYGAAL